MILNKILKICAALAIPGLGLFAACSSDDNVASSFSETNTGKPVEQLGLLAELDTSLVDKRIFGDNPCSVSDSVVDSVYTDSVYQGPMLVKKKDPEVRDSSVIKGGRIMCRPHNDIYLYMDARAQVVDSEGKPVAFAKVYEGVCEYDDPKCQYTTDKDGYFYMDSVNFLTYWENDFAEDVKYAYVEDYRRLQLRAISADSSLGANIYSSFVDASVVKINGKLVAELKKIVVEPVYSTKVYIDSLYVASNENASERDRENAESWNESIRKSIENGEGICLELKDGNELKFEYEKTSPSVFYPCHKVTEEDRKNGYMIMYGLPEGTYNIVIDGTYYSFSPVIIKS